MSEITVYAFEDRHEQSASDWTTQDYREALDYARQHKYRLIARTFTYDDSEMVDDFTEKPRFRVRVERTVTEFGEVLISADDESDARQRVRDLTDDEVTERVDENGGWTFSRSEGPIDACDVEEV